MKAYTLMSTVIGLMTSLGPLRTVHARLTLCKNADDHRAVEEYSIWNMYSNPDHLSKNLRNYVRQLDDNAWLPSDHPIACTGTNICAYVDFIGCPWSGDWSKDPGMYARDAKELANKLVNLRCKRGGQARKGYYMQKGEEGVYGFCEGSLVFDWVQDGWWRCGIEDPESDRPGGVCQEFWEAADMKYNEWEFEEVWWMYEHGLACLQDDKTFGEC